MKNDIQLIKYKKENFFEKIKNRFMKIFSKKEIKNQKEKRLKKETFFEVYEKVKRQEINIEKLDKEFIRKILLMSVEELNINDKNIKQKLSELEISLGNVKMYNKEIELLK